MKFLSSTILVILCLLLPACERIPDTGWAKFSVDGEQYQIEKMFFKISKSGSGLAYELMMVDIPINRDDMLFSTHWQVKTNQPLGELNNKVTREEIIKRGGSFALVLQKKGWLVQADDERNDFWVAIDNVSDDWIKGRFGGSIIIDQDAANIEDMRVYTTIVGGQFDVPLQKRL